MARDENGYVIETVKSRCMIFLLLLNLITTVAVGYCIYAKTPEPIIVNAESSEKEKQENQKFKDNVYQALGFVMSGQSQLVENQNSLNSNKTTSDASNEDKKISASLSLNVKETKRFKFSTHSGVRLGVPPNIFLRMKGNQ